MHRCRSGGEVSQNERNGIRVRITRNSKTRGAGGDSSFCAIIKKILLPGSDYVDGRENMTKAKLRKMLGDINDPKVKELMAVIETQSRRTLARWALDYVRARYLNIYREAVEGTPQSAQEGADQTVQTGKGQNPLAAAQTGAVSTDQIDAALEAVESVLNGNQKFKEIKPALKAAADAARALNENPIGQAAARAITTACGVYQTPTNALGFTFYGAAAHAYYTAGVTAAPKIYNDLAEEELNRILESLKTVALPGEESPVKVKWNC